MQSALFSSSNAFMNLASKLLINGPNHPQFRILGFVRRSLSGGGSTTVPVESGVVATAIVGLKYFTGLVTSKTNQSGTVGSYGTAWFPAILDPRWVNRFQYHT
jgi:hypothetical protein